MKTIFKGWCIEANKTIQLGQTDMPLLWGDGEKEEAQSFIESEYCEDDRAKLIKVEIRRIGRDK